MVLLDIGRSEMELTREELGVLANYHNTLGETIMERAAKRRKDGCKTIFWERAVYMSLTLEREARKHFDRAREIRKQLTL